MKKELQLIENDHASRMKEILDESWKIFKWQFANKVFVREIENEAPFQLHFASVIRSIGNMYVLPGETFYVDLETKWMKSEDKKKYIDITCGFYEFGDKNPKYACAIELKFKRKDYGALPHNLFAIYKDIESLEDEIIRPEFGGDMEKPYYSEGRFYFITNNAWKNLIILKAVSILLQITRTIAASPPMSKRRTKTTSINRLACQGTRLIRISFITRRKVLTKIGKLTLKKITTFFGKNIKMTMRHGISLKLT